MNNKLTFIQSLPCYSHRANDFTCIISINLHDSPMRWAVISPNLQMSQLRLGIDPQLVVREGRFFCFVFIKNLACLSCPPSQGLFTWCKGMEYPWCNSVWPVTTWGSPELQKLYIYADCIGISSLTMCMHTLYTRMHRHKHAHTPLPKIASRSESLSVLRTSTATCTPKTPSIPLGSNLNFCSYLSSMDVSWKHIEKIFNHNYKLS